MGLKPGSREPENQKTDAEKAVRGQQTGEPEVPTESKKKSGLSRGTPETPVDEKIAGALRYLANDKMSMSTHEPWKQLDERNRSSAYVGTNVSEFTAEQQAVIKTAIMDAAKKTVLPNGNAFSGIDDVKFQKGKNGSTVIEVQGQLNMDVDLKKLMNTLEGQKDKFKDLKINSQMTGITSAMNSDIADAVKGYSQAMQEMNSGQNKAAIEVGGKQSPAAGPVGRGR